MPTLPFHTLDVFTQTPYTGNPLAVVLDADRLSTRQMQRIAAEFNLSETVFVQAPRQGGNAKLRIFTPALELPFAGHPTVGSAVLLAQLGVATGEHIVLEENVGLVAVTLQQTPGEPWFAELTTAVAPEIRTPDYNPASVAAVLGLAPEAVATVQMASCGTPMSVVRLTQPEHLSAIAFNPQACSQLLAGSWTHGLYVVAQGYEGEWQARFFAPDMGMGEDPATGAAAAAFAGALALADTREACEQAVPIVQGVTMGRPSQLYARYVRRAHAVASVHVGGYAVAISSGTLLVP